MVVGVRACAVGVLDEKDLASGGTGGGCEVDCIFGSDRVVVVVGIGWESVSRGCRREGRELVSDWMSAAMFLVAKLVWDWGG